MRTRNYLWWCLPLLLLALLTNPPAQAASAIRGHKTGTNKIALTFDDGPHPHDTDEILAILDEYHVHATFFMIGQNVEAYPDVAARVVAAGHEIGNHTYSHPHLQNISQAVLAEELTHADNVFEKHLGITPTLFRPPEGVATSGVLAVAEQRDYRAVLWSVDTRDWSRPPVPQIVRAVMNRVTDGDIILFHDYVVGGSSTPAALRNLLPRLLAAGYSPVTVSDLLSV